MTKQELENKYFHEFLIWCATQPSEDATVKDLFFWLDHNSPTLDNFWEWMVRCNKDNLRGQNDTR